MNLVLKNSSEAPCKTGKDFNVVAMCGHETAPKACEVLQLVQKNLEEEEGRLIYQWWTYEFLEVNEFLDLAAFEAAQADMVIIGIHEGRELPEAVAVWINRWIGLRKDRPGALVAVLDSDRKMPYSARGILSQLKQAAALGKMDFFVTQAKERKGAGEDIRKAGVAARQSVLERKTGGRNGLPGRWTGAGGNRRFLQSIQTQTT
jgi:hypothetical protein